MALASALQNYQDECGYINCWVDTLPRHCRTACKWRMYKFCRLVGAIARMIWEYAVDNEFCRTNLNDKIEFRLGMGSLAGELSWYRPFDDGWWALRDPNDGVVAFAYGKSPPRYELGEPRVEMEWDVFSLQLYDALFEHRINIWRRRNCVLEWYFRPEKLFWNPLTSRCTIEDLRSENARALKEAINGLLTKDPMRQYLDGIQARVGVELMGDSLHLDNYFFESGYKVRITLSLYRNSRWKGTSSAAKQYCDGVALTTAPCRYRALIGDLMGDMTAAYSVRWSQSP